MQHSELTDGDGVLACKGYPAPGLGQAFSCCPRQRYLDEAEREKQQYMKELRAYQQSEAYKMCTEKIDPAPPPSPQYPAQVSLPATPAHPQVHDAVGPGLDVGGSSGRTEHPASMSPI